MDFPRIPENIYVGTILRYTIMSRIGKEGRNEVLKFFDVLINNRNIKHLLAQPYPLKDYLLLNCIHYVSIYI